MPIYNKNGKQLVFDLINAANPQPVPFTENNCVIEKVTPGNWTVDGVTYNTQARVRGQPGQGYTGSKIVYYNRLSLPTLLIYVNPTVQSYSATDLHSVLPVFNRNYGLNITVADVQNAALSNPNTPNYTGTVTMTPLASSPLLTANTAALTYLRGLPYLDVYVVSTVLDAYIHPVTDVTKKSAQLLTYGLDFTDYANLLLVDGTGMPNFSALQQVLTQTYGLPAWDAPLNSNYVTDNATANVTGANKNFDRVVVQTGISNSQVVGFAYYHYMV